MVTTDTDAIIAAIETELAAEWYSHAAAERRAQRDNVRAASIIPRLPRAPSLVEFALAVAVWAVFPVALLLCVWVVG